MSKKTYNKEQKEAILNSIFDDISKGLSLRKACKNGGIPRMTFYNWIDEDQKSIDRYTRAKEQGIEARFESIEEDYNEEPQRDPETGKIDSAWVQLQRLKIDSKKWELSKLAPKKYGDKIDVTSKGESIQTPSIVNVKIVEPED
jgi:hypothetical protein